MDQDPILSNIVAVTVVITGVIVATCFCIFCIIALIRFIRDDF